MVIINNGPYITTTLVYDAPVDEKTKKLREEFKIDESGYPEHYRWRSLAKLGRQYNPEDPFLKFDPPEEERSYPTKVLVVGGSILACFGGVAVYNVFNRRPAWSKAHFGAGLAALVIGTAYFVLKKTEERQFIKNAQIIDYTNQHPERFGPITRYKFREVIYPYTPVR